MKPFARKDVQPGTRLVLKREPSTSLIFKGYGHNGMIVARLIDGEATIFNRSRDAILRPADVLIWEAA